MRLLTASAGCPWFCEEWNEMYQLWWGTFCACALANLSSFLFLYETWTRLWNSWSALCSLLHKSHLFGGCWVRPWTPSIPTRLLGDPALLKSESSCCIFCTFAAGKPRQAGSHTSVRWWKLCCYIIFQFRKLYYRVQGAVTTHTQSLFEEALLQPWHCGPKRSQWQHECTVRPFPPLLPLPFVNDTVPWKSHWVKSSILLMGIPCSSVGKESACSAGDRVRSLGGEDPLEKEMATHSSILAWKISRTEEPGGLQSMGSQRDGHDWLTLMHIII